MGTMDHEITIAWNTVTILVIINAIAISALLGMFVHLVAKTVLSKTNTKTAPNSRKISAPPGT